MGPRKVLSTSTSTGRPDRPERSATVRAAGMSQSCIVGFAGDSRNMSRRFGSAAARRESSSSVAATGKGTVRMPYSGRILRRKNSLPP
jgi:hypothetical protein